VPPLSDFLFFLLDNVLGILTGECWFSLLAHELHLAKTVVVTEFIVQCCQDGESD
jgi:hypothetical protein